MLGEWKPKDDGLAHWNYGKTYKEKNDFGFHAIEIAYGKN